jgi:hypothetical protein
MTVVKLTLRPVAGAMGAFLIIISRAVRTPTRLKAMREPLGPLSSVDLAALVQLCNLKKVIQRNDGYGTGSETIISSASAAMLKRRNLAVTGWSREMYPTKSGHAFVAGYARISSTPS